MTQAVLTWDDVKCAALDAFNYFSDRHELRWAEEAWGRLCAAGLADASTASAQTRSVVRFMALASFWRDWASLAWDERWDDDLGEWADSLDLSALHVGQLLGPDDDYEETADALAVLVARERQVVHATLLEAYGGTSGLFIALWRSNQSSEPPTDPEDLESWEDDAAVVNDVTPEKLRAFSWLEDGCPSVR